MTLSVAAIFFPLTLHSHFLQSYAKHHDLWPVQIILTLHPLPGTEQPDKMQSNHFYSIVNAWGPILVHNFLFPTQLQCHQDGTLTKIKHCTITWKGKRWSTSLWWTSVTSSSVCGRREASCSVILHVFPTFTKTLFSLYTYWFPHSKYGPNFPSVKWVSLSSINKLFPHIITAKYHTHSWLKVFEYRNLFFG